MKNRLRNSSAATSAVFFPPEADDEFEVVDERQIADWRKQLEKEYGIGQNKLKVIHEPTA